MNYFLENLDILSKKFPYIYMLLISKRETKKKTVIYKAGIQNLKLDRIDILFIYKCVISQEACEDIKTWLQDQNKKVYFFDDDLNNLSFFFQSKIAYELLKQDNVIFCFFSNIDQLIEQVTSTIKTKKINVITFTKNSKRFLFLKKEIQQHCLISLFGVHDKIFSYKIFKNFYFNLDKLKSSFLINRFKNKFKNMPAIVLGAGPSLKYSFEILKTLQDKSLLIAGGSAITCLSQMNILPHLGVIIDPNFDEYQRMKEALSYEIPIIYSTRVNHGVFKTFNGPLGYIKGEICGFFEVWLDEQLKILDKCLYAKHSSKALTVTSTCLIIAKLMGCNPIILDGIDLCYSQDQRYAVDIIPNNKLNELHSDNEETYIFKNKNNKEVRTNLNWEIENDWISSFAKENKNTKFINATKDGLKIEGIVDKPLSEIENEYLKKQFDFKAYIHFLSQKNLIVNAQKQDFSLMKLALKESLERCLKYLQDILDNDPEYKAILAKEELQNEIAYKYFLIELNYTINKFYPDSNNFDKIKEITELFLLSAKI